MLNDNDARKQNYWVLRAMGFTNTETLLYCREHRRITLTWEGEPFCCLKAALEARLSEPWWNRMSNEDIAAELSATFDLNLETTRKIADWILKEEA